MNADSELKSCPFCGSVPERDDGFGGFGGYVSCGNALCFMFDPAPAERMWAAIAAWNTRPAPTEAEVNSAYQRIRAEWPAAPYDGRPGDAINVDELCRRMARAALGVGDG